MTVFNIGDEVVYKGPYTSWIGTEGIVISVPDRFDQVRIKLTTLIGGSRSYRLGEVIILHKSKLELSYLKYDPAQQADEDGGV